MSVLEKLKLAQNNKTIFITKKEQKIPFKLLPALNKKEISDIEMKFSCKFDDTTEELLSFCSGFESPLGLIDFSGNKDWEMSDIFPKGFPIADNGQGDFWIVDLSNNNPNNSDFSHIFFASHDPPVIVYQSYTLEHFIDQVFALGSQPWESEITQAQESFAHSIWQNNCGELSFTDCLNSNSPELISFANNLDNTFVFFDLRKAKFGDGFSWGRFGANTVCERYEEEHIFAIQKRKLSIWQKIFGV